jgi:methylthioribose-1-phosphate isomerase
VNYYFDLTPLACVTGVVTEKGILTRAELWEMLG